MRLEIWSEPNLWIMGRCRCFYATKKKQKSMQDKRQRVDASGVAAMDYAPESVNSVVTIEYEINNARSICNEGDFTGDKGVTLGSLKQKLNPSLPINEQLKQEDVFACKPHWGELVTKMKISKVHSTRQIKALLKAGQGKDLFNNVVESHVAERPVSAQKDTHMITLDELGLKLDDFLARLEKGEVQEKEEMKRRRKVQERMNSQV